MTKLFLYLEKMSLLKQVNLVIMVIVMTDCTTGRLEYLTAGGEYKTACETEYTWAPSVDKYALEYVLSYCAKRALEQGNTLLDSELLSVDLTLPATPIDHLWSFELAKKLHGQKKLTDKEYAYLITYLDLGLNNSSSE